MSISRDFYKKAIKIEIGCGLKKVFKIWTNNSMKAVYLVRKAEYLYGKRSIKRVLSKYYIYKLGKYYGIFISPKTSIGIGLKFPHPNGIIIGECVNIRK